MNHSSKLFFITIVTLATACLLSAGSLAQTEPAAPANSAATGQIPYQPKFRGDPAKSEAESQTLGYMRTVVRAEKIYMARQKEYAPSLLALGGHGSFTKRMARSTERGDYSIHYKAKKDSYQLFAIPQHLGPDHRAFYADEDGKIRVEEEKLAGPESPILK
jgi:hypothetical protein